MNNVDPVWIRENPMLSSQFLFCKVVKYIQYSKYYSIVYIQYKFLHQIH